MVRELNAKPLKRLPQRATTKHKHERLVKALGVDRRLKRAFN